MKIKKIKFLVHLIKIIKTIMIILAVGLIALFLALQIYPAWFEQFLNGPWSGWYLDLDGLTLNLPDVNLSMETVGSFLKILCLELILVVVISIYGLQLLYNILRPIAKNEPFIPVVAENVKKLAWLSLLMIFFSPAVNGLTQFMFLQQFDFSAILKPEISYSIQFEYVLNVTNLIIPAFLFALSSAFKHGQKLQEFNDDAV